MTVKSTARRYHLKSIAPETYIRSLATFERHRIWQFISSLKKKHSGVVYKKPIADIARAVRTLDFFV